MGRHLEFGVGLRRASFDEPIRQTFLGQAHIAGTGPAGKTCRECMLWHAWKRQESEEHRFGDWVPSNVEYEACDADRATLRLKDAPCNKRILNKADDKVPHFALACMFFEQREDPQSPEYELDTQGWHPAPHKDGKWKVVFGPLALKIARGPTGDRLAVFGSYAAAVQRAITMNEKELAHAG
ncbi:hypothetical protein IWQ49_006395 [Labrenzia sp. EL_126]|nr:hypothetical protein [Labrenzia sp. EL_126]